RRDRARVDDGKAGAGVGTAQPITTVDDLGSQLRRDLTLKLLDRTGRQAQVDGAALLIAQPALFLLLLALALNVIECPVHDHRELVDEGWLERGQSVLGHAD